MAEGGMSGGQIANVLGTSLLGYWAGKKAEQRQGEIAGTAATLADPFAAQRPYYQSMLGQLYGMPEDYGEKPPEDKKSANPAENLLYMLMGGQPEAGDPSMFLSASPMVMQANLLGGLL